MKNFIDFRSCYISIFISSNFYFTLTKKRTRITICSFYNEDELYGAKDVLLKVIGQVLRDGDVDVDMPRLPKISCLQILCSLVLSLVPAAVVMPYLLLRLLLITMSGMVVLCQFVP